jgi:alkylation response protein AidB-like acyl-CoA dehydrogenase
MATLLDKRHPTTARAPESDGSPVDSVLSRIDAVAPLVARHVRDIEQDRRLPADIVSGLKSARIYSMLVPRRHGGLALDAPNALRVVSALARLDGSLGWNVMIGHLGSLLPFLATPILCDQIFRDGKDHIIAGSGQPVGTAERCSEGWKVTGAWPFASGCQDAEWIMGTCVMVKDGSPITASDGPGPMIRTCLMPAEHWEIRDTWYTFGLQGTGSHDVALRDVFVPEQNFFEFPFGTSFAPDRIFSRFPDFLVLSHCAFAVGVAEGAVQDLVALARSGVKQMRMTVPLVETERFKEALGRLDAELAAARSLLDTKAAHAWQNTERATAKDLTRFAEMQGLAVWITSTCIRVAEGCVELAGSRAVYQSSPLQRRMRDLQVAAQHAVVHPRNYVSAGAAMLSRLS